LILIIKLKIDYNFLLLKTEVMVSSLKKYDFLTEFTQFTQQIIPYFIMSNKSGVNPMYLIGLPIAIRLFLYLGTKLFNYVWFKKELSVIRVASRAGPYEHNKTYDYLIWYLSNNLNNQMLHQLRNETFFVIKDHSTDLETETVYEIDHQFLGKPIEYIFQDQKLTFSPTMEELKMGKETQDIKIISISASDLTLIQNFINHCQKKYLDHFRKQQKQYYRFFEWIDDKKQWSCRKIETLKTLENIFLEPTMKQTLKNYLDKFIESKPFYQEMGIPHKKGMMFYGKPGNGKTSTEYAIANHYKRDIYSVHLDELGTSEKLKIAMSLIKNDAIVVFEDIDTHSITHERNDKKKHKSSEMSEKSEKSAYARTREANLKATLAMRLIREQSSSLSDSEEHNNGSNDSNYSSSSDSSSNEISDSSSPDTSSNDSLDVDSESDNPFDMSFNSSIIRAQQALIDRVTAPLTDTSTFSKSGLFQTLLEILDGYNYLNGAMIIMTTNHPEMLDNALIRYGRIDHKFYFDNPTQENLTLILQRFCKLDESAPILDKFMHLPVPNDLSSAEFINSIIIPNLDEPEKIVQVYRERGQSKPNCKFEAPKQEATPRSDS